MNTLDRSICPGQQFLCSKLFHHSDLSGLGKGHPEVIQGISVLGIQGPGPLIEQDGLGSSALQLDPGAKIHKGDTQIDLRKGNDLGNLNFFLPFA